MWRDIAQITKKTPAAGGNGLLVLGTIKLRLNRGKRTIYRDETKPLIFRDKIRTYFLQLNVLRP